MKRYRGPRTDIEYVLLFPLISSFQKHPANDTSRMHLFLKRSTRPSLTKLEEKDLVPFQASDNIVFIAYLPPSSPISTTFTKLADKHSSKYTFGILESEDLPTGKDGNVLSSIVAYKREEGEFGAFKGEDGDMKGLDAQLEKWVDDVSKPLIGEFNRKSEMGYLKVCYSLLCQRKERIADTKTGWEVAHIHLPPQRRTLRSRSSAISPIIPQSSKRLRTLHYFSHRSSRVCTYAGTTWIIFFFSLCHKPSTSRL